MTSKETVAIRYTFFRFPSHYALMVIPIITGIVSVLFFQQLGEVKSNNHWDLVNKNHFDLTQRYLNYSKVALVFVISFFLTFKWSLMQTDGSYGFWLTQKVNRRMFYIRAITRFILESYFAIIIGILLLMYPIGIKFTLTQFMYLITLLFFQIVILIASSILFAEIIPSPEIASLTYLIWGIMNFLINTNESNIFHKILKADLHYQNNDISIPFASSILIATILLALSFVIHTRRSVDL